MTRDEIIEVFLVAADADRRLPNTAKPATLKAMNLGAVHSYEEMLHWGTERLHEAAWEWLDPAKLRVTRNQVGLWLASMELIKLCENEKNRRALFAWARSQAGSGSFSRWCRRVEGISRQLGDWRKNAAISQIELAFRSKVDLHKDRAEYSDFTEWPEIGHKTDKIRVFRDYDASAMYRCYFDEEIAGTRTVETADRRARKASQAA